MGTNTDAKLMFGFLVEENSSDHEECNKMMDEDYDKLQVIEKKTGCTIEYHCSGDFTMYAICVKDTVITAWRGDPKKIDPHMMMVFHHAPWKNKLQEFCNETGITYKDPAWWMMSYWG